MRIKYIIISFVFVLFSLVCFSGCTVNVNDNEVVVNDNNVAVKINDNEVQINSKSIIKTVSPIGFAGASMHKLNLYSNGDLHLVIYNGEGFEESNIISDEVIAKNATEIIQDEESDGMITVKGKNIEIIKDKYGWIKFENE